MEKRKVFLGGTCNDSKWREKIMDKMLIDYFNPVVEDWNEEAYQRELREREESEFCLYTLTAKMTGYYSIAEAVDDSNKKEAGKTILCVLKDDDGVEFNDHQFRNLSESVGGLIEKNGGKVFTSLDEVVDYLNQFRTNEIRDRFIKAREEQGGEEALTLKTLEDLEKGIIPPPISFDKIDLNTIGQSVYIFDEED